MAYFIVCREAGPAWVAGGIESQPGGADHATFMGDLEADGFVLCAGPVAGSETDRLRALLVVEARDRSEIERRLAADPWEIAGRLRIASIESWRVFVGAHRLQPDARV